MSAVSPQALTIAIDEPARRCPACCKCRARVLLCLRAWRRRRHGASLHGGHRERSRRARHRTLRYQFPYMERGSKRPDPPRSPMPPCAPQWPRPHAAARSAAVRGRQVVRRPHDVAGPGRGAFPASRPGLPRLPAASRRQASDERAPHLFDVQVPMLFLQGTRDELAELPLLQPLVKRLGARATLSCSTTPTIRSTCGRARRATSQVRRDAGRDGALDRAAGGLEPLIAVAARRAVLDPDPGSGAAEQRKGGAQQHRPAEAGHERAAGGRHHDGRTAAIVQRVRCATPRCSRPMRCPPLRRRPRSSRWWSAAPP